MSNESTISDLRAAIEEVEEKKREIDKQHSALITALEYFESMEKTVVDETGDERGGEEDTVPW